MTSKAYIAAAPGEIYWRYEVCPHIGSKVLLLTTGGICIIGHWYGELNKTFVAWCPMPKKGGQPPDISAAPFMTRVKFAFRLIFGNQKKLWNSW